MPSPTTESPNIETLAEQIKKRTALDLKLSQGTPRTSSADTSTPTGPSNPQQAARAHVKSLVTSAFGLAGIDGSIDVRNGKKVI
jgi:hypothetical protein